MSRMGPERLNSPHRSPSPERARFMGYIRRFTESDILEVARIHRRPSRRRTAPTRRGSLVLHVLHTRLLENPWQDAGLRSLVYQEDDGHLSGFLGVVPRPMTMNGRRIQAAISRSSSSSLRRMSASSLQLARAFLEGPQDLSIADEATDLSRKIWEGLGGTTSLLHSLHWTRPLRPGGLTLSMMRGRQRLVPLAVTAAPLAPMIDALVTRMSHSQFYQAGPEVSRSADHRRFLTCLPTLVGPHSLRVDYDVPTFRWLLERARAKGEWQPSRCGGEGRRPNRRLVCLSPRAGPDCDRPADRGRCSECRSDVLDQLFYQAGQHGAIAVTGRAEPR